MAKKNNGHSAQPEASAVESTQQATTEPPREAQPEQQSDGVAPPTQTANPYASHDNRRLREEHDVDVAEAERLRALLAPIEERIEARGSVIAERLLDKARTEKTGIPCVTFGGVQFQPKARPAKFGGGSMLTRYTPRVQGSFE